MEEHKEHHKKHSHEAHKPQHHVYSPHKPKKMKKTHVWQALSAILAILLIVSIFTGGFGIGAPSSGSPLSSDDAADKAVGYINENLLTAGQEATLGEVEEEANLYKMKLKIAGQEYDSFITKDGKYLFPSAIDLENIVEQPDAPATQTPAPTPSVAKQEKPEVELFVMTHCPFGTQIEKGFIPVVNLLGDKIDYEVKFVYYAMHGKKELDEQLLQYCIQKDQKEKFIPYLECFLDKGETETCLEKAAIDTDMSDNCIQEADEEFKVSEQFEDQSTWLSGRFPLFDVHKEENEEYGVRGSPNLVVNGASVSSARDAASLLNTICAGFENPPEECDEELSAAAPSPGFGFEGTGSDTAATCG